MNTRELASYIRDAMRYREMRKHRNRGYPEPGVPYACGWQLDEDSDVISDIGHIREGELDAALDEVLENEGVDLDKLYDDLFSSPWSDK